MLLGHQTLCQLPGDLVLGLKPLDSVSQAVGTWLAVQAKTAVKLDTERNFFRRPLLIVLEKGPQITSVLTIKGVSKQISSGIKMLSHHQVALQ